LALLGLTTRLFAASDVCSNQGLNWPICQQNSDIYAWAVHTECPRWDAAGAYATAGSKRPWMTEWDIAVAGTIGPTDYMKTGTSLMSAMKAGFTYWTWFHYSNCVGAGSQGADQVDTLWVPDKRFYGTKMFTRFIRADAVRIGCTGGSASSAAFRNPDNTIAVIFVNSGGAATETISGTGLPATWHVYRTSATENCAYIGESNGTGISVPASSIVSVISGSKVPEIPADTIPYRVGAPVPDMTVGKLNARGDDLLRVWVNGVEVPTEKSGGDYGNNSVKQRMVSIKQGENVVACWIRNIAWGGGLLTSMMLPGGDTLHSDGAWKVSIVNPEGNAAWNTEGFDISSWKNAFEVGDVMNWPGFPRWGSQAVNLYYQGAQNIIGGDHVYFRKVITFPHAATGIYVRGNNFKYKMYIDGTLVKEGTEFASCTGDNRCFMVPNSVSSFSFAQGSTHCIAFDIEDAAKDGNGVLMKAGYGRQSPPVPVPMDSTWWVSDNAPAGWNTVAYTDTTTWAHPRVIDAYDVGSKPGSFIFPGDFWFRTTFTSSESGVWGPAAVPAAADRVASVKYYTLQGREITGDLRTLPMSIVLRRTTYMSGRIEQMRVVRASQTGR